MNRKLPKYPNNKHVGNIAASMLQSILQRFCIFSTISEEHDIGIDFNGTVLDGEKPTMYNFNAQCKGTKNTDCKLNLSGTDFSYSIKVSTINYWKQKKDPTFLFLVDLQKRNAYWVAPLHQLEEKAIDNQDFVTIHISKRDCLNYDTSCLPQKFIYEIVRYYACFYSGIETQLKALQSGSLDINNEKYLVDIADVLEENADLTESEINKIRSKIIKKIKLDIRKSINYCFQLDHMDEVPSVRKYCPEGIFDTKFLTYSDGEKTIREYEDEINLLLKKKNISLKELIKLSRNLYEFKTNILIFLREMVNEDMPFTYNKYIEDEVTNCLKEGKEMYGIDY